MVADELAHPGDYLLGPLDGIWNCSAMITTQEIACAKESTRMIPFLRKGTTLLDIGSNVGEFSLAAKSLFKNIIAVEAHPVTARRARARFSKDNSITVVNLAVTKRTEDALWVSSPNHSTSSSVRPAKRLKNPPRGYYKSIASIGFNELLKNYKPSAVKMDIEGCEWECLEGAQFNKELKQLLVEFHGVHHPQKAKQFRVAQRFLKAKGFERTRPERLPAIHAMGGYKTWNLMTLFTRK